MPLGGTSSSAAIEPVKDSSGPVLYAGVRGPIHNFYQVKRSASLASPAYIHARVSLHVTCFQPDTDAAPDNTGGLADPGHSSNTPSPSDPLLSPQLRPVHVQLHPQGYALLRNVAICISSYPTIRDLHRGCQGPPIFQGGHRLVYTPPFKPCRAPRATRAGSRLHLSLTPNQTPGSPPRG